jgi:hypothetical protein
MKALHPSWTPGQIKSALMTTATTEVVKEDLTTAADPFDMGAGRVRLEIAGNPGVTFDATAADMIRLGTDPLNAVHLNVPSVNAPTMPGRLETTRVATNVSGRRLRYDILTVAPEGSTITVSPKRLNLANGESAEIRITIESTAETEQMFGEIHLKPRNDGYPDLHLPVAFVPQQGDVSLTTDCNPTEISRGDTTLCTIEATNESPETTTVSLTTSTNRNLQLTQAIGATLVGGEARLVTELVGDRPGIPSVDPGSIAGYIPLAAFGVAPIAIGDEAFINFNVPAFSYNGRIANRIGVNSNGYIVVGGGTAEDNECCTLPPGADPSRPNNLLAPFWTDLDGTGAQGIRATVLTDGVDSWIVVEWQVNVFGTTSNRHFQVWIGTTTPGNPAQDIAFAYDPAALPAAPGSQPFLVGAENELGEGDVSSFLPTQDLRVSSTNPTPGGSASYIVRARGQRVGDGVVTTEMFSEILPGVTIVREDVKVTR